MSDTITILSIDPGTTAMGYAYSEYNQRTGTFRVLSGGVIYPIKDATCDKVSRKLVKNFGQRLVNVAMVQKAYTDLVDTYHADRHVAEGAFFNPRRPTAYALLSICIFTMAQVLFVKFRDDPSVIDTATLHTIAPTAIKKAISKGTAGKVDVRDAVLGNKHIVIDSSLQQYVDISHFTDAVACGYAYASEIGVLSGADE